MIADPARDRRHRRLLIGLALMFFAPLGFSFYLYYGAGGWHPGGHVNKGQLVQPPRPLPALHDAAQLLTGKWTFLYAQHGACDPDCLRRLYDTRQVRLALDREMGRVQRVFIADADCCDFPMLRAQHPDLVISADDPTDAPLRALLPTPPGVLNSHRVYLIDPLGNLMMFYEPGAPAKGMLEDMKRLLALSNIG